MASVFLGLCLLPGTSLACSVCYGDPADPMSRGLVLAMWALLGVTYFVLIGFAAMFITIAVRSRKRIERQEAEGVPC